MIKVCNPRVKLYTNESVMFLFHPGFSILMSPLIYPDFFVNNHKTFVGVAFVMGKIFLEFFSSCVFADGILKDYINCTGMIELLIRRQDGSFEPSESCWKERILDDSSPRDLSSHLTQTLIHQHFHC